MRTVVLITAILLAGCGKDQPPVSAPPPVEQLPPVVTPPPDPVPEPTPVPDPIPEPPVPQPEPPAPQPEPPAPVPTCDGVAQPTPEIDSEGFTYVGEIVVQEDWSWDEKIMGFTNNPPKCWDWVWIHHESPSS